MSTVDKTKNEYNDENANEKHNASTGSKMIELNQEIRKELKWHEQRNMDSLNVPPYHVAK